jgi:hypothetical protein
LSVFFNDGAGRLGSRTDYATVAVPLDAALGDLNGDGAIDVVVASHSEQPALSVFLGTGNGGLGPRTDYVTGSGPFAVAIGDLNSDDHLDVVTTDVGEFLMERMPSSRSCSETEPDVWVRIRSTPPARIRVRSASAT